MSLTDDIWRGIVDGSLGDDRQDSLRSLFASNFAYRSLSLSPDDRIRTAHQFRRFFAFALFSLSLDDETVSSQRSTQHLVI